MLKTIFLFFMCFYGVVIKKQFFTLMFNVAIITTNPLFAMDMPEDPFDKYGDDTTLHILQALPTGREVQNVGRTSKAMNILSKTAYWVVEVKTCLSIFIEKEL